MRSINRQSEINKGSFAQKQNNKNNNKHPFESSSEGKRSRRKIIKRDGGKKTENQM